jgi:hypothetical protein
VAASTPRGSTTRSTPGPGTSATDPPARRSRAAPSGSVGVRAPLIGSLCEPRPCCWKRCP